MRAGGCLVLVVAALAAIVPNVPGVRAQANAALSGSVRSTGEGAMEGVLVNARREGGNVTVTVVSDAAGRYTFPRSHLEPGSYRLSIRATGYELTDPGAVQVTATATATRDLDLRTSADPALHMSSTEWAMSFPGTPEQIFPIANHGCTYCHTLERLARSKHSAEQWVDVLTRMQIYFLDGTAVAEDRGRGAPNDAEAVAAAAKNPNSVGGRPKTELGQYMASLNLSGGRTTWSYPLKTLPRPSGAATRVIMTQWDLPRKDTVAHDLAVDAQGRPWYNDQSRMFVGMLDPATSQFTEYPFPPLPRGRAGGVSDLDFDRDGNLWTMISLPEGKCHFGTPVKFDPRTKDLTYVEIANKDEVFGTNNPCGLQFMARGPDGRMWFNNTQVMVRVDPKTARVDGTFFFGKGANVPEGRHVGYQVVVSSKGNGYISDFGGRSYVIEVNGTTGEPTYHPVPTANGGARRGQMDAQDRYWFAEYRGNKAAMFDTKNGSFKEWEIPVPYVYPYTSSAPDRKGRVYLSSNMAERLYRLDPATGEMVGYLVPTAFDSKKILYDPTASGIRLWLSNKRTARLLRVDVLD
ncbi:MAG: hypothetical protein FJW23_11105 [Acidimicrobiia bacterium]|nr:hypothetical protein [Acidimicrobiia bacterium]